VFSLIQRAHLAHHAAYSARLLRWALVAFVLAVVALVRPAAADVLGAQEAPRQSAPALDVMLPGPKDSVRDADMASPRDAIQLPSSAEIPRPPEGFNTYNGGWIKIAFPPSKRHRVQPLINESDAFRDRLRELFDYPVLNNVTVHIARTAGEMATLAPPGAPFPAYAEGVAYPGLGLILLTIEPRHHNARHDLGEVFRHELAHLALRDALESHDVPLWLNEGFAIHLSGESMLARMQTLWTATLAETLIPLNELGRRFPNDSVQTPIAYAQSGDVVRHLLRTRYTQRFVAMLRRVRGGQTFERAMLDSYGFDAYGLGVNSLEDEWRREVAKRYSFWPVLLSGSMVWVGALGLFVVGYYRKRKQQRVTLDRWAVEEAQQQAVEEQGAAGRMHIVIAPKEVPVEGVVPGLERASREVEVPKVEHDGSWHTLH
jgi:hypothetical protein